MNNSEKHVARIFFKNKVYESDGQKFEDLFRAIMHYKESDFIQIKPWGNIGDRKNDGYVKSKGIYFQVFAPEDIRKSYPDIIKKIQTDFDGLKEEWENVREFYFVLNDKYKGVHADSEKLLDKIKISNSLVECAFVLPKDLENWLFSLKDDEITNIVGIIPDPNNLRELNYDILNEILEHIKNIPLENKDENITLPNWDEKIQFNGLSEVESTRLLNGYFQLSTLENYLKNNSEFTANQLQNRINSIYVQLRDKCENSIDIFWELVNTISPKDRPEYQASAIVIMAKYFETCDIFEEPKL